MTQKSIIICKVMVKIKRICNYEWCGMLRTEALRSRPYILVMISLIFVLSFKSRAWCHDEASKFSLPSKKEKRKNTNKALSQQMHNRILSFFSFHKREVDVPLHGNLFCSFTSGRSKVKVEVKGRVGLGSSAAALWTAPPAGCQGTLLSLPRNFCISANPDYCWR